MPIKVSTMVPVERKLEDLDPSGKTFVIIVPPTQAAEARRGALLAKRSYSYDENNFLVTQVDCNLRELWEWEIFLTYGGTNLEVEIEGSDEPTVIKFLSPDQETVSSFMNKLGQLPPDFVVEWRLAVMEVAPAWRNPF